jgi:hypothetical protein
MTKNIQAHSADLPKNNDGSLSAYAWPGGYPIFYLDNQNSVLCARCAQKNYSEPEPVFFIVAADANYENDSLYCDECSDRIECAYGSND